MDLKDLNELPPLRDVIAAYDLRAEKALGQNFLLDQNITDKIARLAGEGYILHNANQGGRSEDGFSCSSSLEPDRQVVSSLGSEGEGTFSEGERREALGLQGFHVVEVGPGPGGLTRSLLRAGAKSVTAIELDQRAVGALQSLKDAAGGRLEVVHGDALGMDLVSMVPAPRMIVANLPYNVATPLLVNWLRDLCNDSGAYVGMALMFQKEVAQRIIAQGGDKHYGRLAVLCQWLTSPRIVYDLPPSAFTPPPKVNSAVVYFAPKTLDTDQPDFIAVEKVTAAAFGQRRKMIRSSLKDYADGIEALGLDPTLRAENLEIEDFLKLAKYGKVA